MTSKLIIAVCLFAAVLIGKLAVDFQLYQSRKVNEHLLGPVIVFIVLVVCSFLAGWKSVGIWFMGYWILFNGFYAVLIGQKWGFLGTTSKLDIFERKNKWVTPAKYILFIGSVIFFIYATV